MLTRRDSADAANKGSTRWLLVTCQRHHVPGPSSPPVLSLPCFLPVSAQTHLLGGRVPQPHLEDRPPHARPRPLTHVVLHVVLTGHTLLIASPSRTPRLLLTSLLQHQGQRLAMVTRHGCSSQEGINAFLRFSPRICDFPSYYSIQSKGKSKTDGPIVLT